MKRLAILIAVISVCLGINAQTDGELRFGYLSYETALKSMSDYDIVQQKLADLRQQFKPPPAVPEHFRFTYESFSAIVG